MLAGHARPLTGHPAAWKRHNELVGIRETGHTGIRYRPYELELSAIRRYC
jgi:hypothetical protein